MNRVRVVLAAPLLLSAILAEPRAQTPAPTAGDLVVVEAAVVDKTGRPVPGLTPDQFEVTIDGRAHRVVAATFVDAARANAVGLPGPDAGGGRLVFIAIDRNSFSALESVAVCVAAQTFVDNLLANDRVGVLTYPSGVSLDPTTDRVAIRKALETVVVAPSALGASPAGPPPPPRAGLESLHQAVERFASIPDRKYLVIVTPGLPGSPEQVGDLPERISRQAAVSNTTIYTVFVDRGFIDLTIQEKDRIAMVSPTRDIPQNALLRWLDRLTTPSGGAIFQVNGINPEPLLARMSYEMSGYYTLHVEGANLDRSSVLRDLSVKVKTAGAIVRAASWMVASKRAAGPSAPALVRPVPEAPPPPPPSRPSSDPILAAYERGEYATMQERLLREPSVSKWVHDFRSNPRPWPATPMRAAVFSLEVAAATLSTTDGVARDEAVKLLVEQGAIFRPGTFSETFTCLWYWGALMLLEGSEHPEAAPTLAARALATCPTQPRIALANAVLLDQAAPILVGGIRVGAAAAAESRAHKAVTEAYQAAMKFSETETEARVREAWFFVRLKRFEEALNLLAEIGPSASPVPTLEESFRRQIDRQIRYVGHLIEGHALRAQGRTAQAAAAYRQAMQDWPGAQAARLALMTVLGIEGRTDEAASLAAAIETAPEDTTDPWWWFWQGDRVLYQALMANMREFNR